MNPDFYKSVYLRLKEKYPAIAAELETVEVEISTGNIFAAYTLFCQQKGIIQIEKQHRELFTAVMLKVFSPIVFEKFRRKTRKGLRDMLSALLSLQGDLASYYIKKAQNLYDVYPPFRVEVDEISEVIKNKLIP